MVSHGSLEFVLEGQIPMNHARPSLHHTCKPGRRRIQQYRAVRLSQNLRRQDLEIASDDEADYDCYTSFSDVPIDSPLYPQAR